MEPGWLQVETDENNQDFQVRNLERNAHKKKERRVKYSSEDDFTYVNDPPEAGSDLSKELEGIIPRSRRDNNAAYPCRPEWKTL